MMIRACPHANDAVASVSISFTASEISDDFLLKKKRGTDVVKWQLPCRSSALPSLAEQWAGHRGVLQRDLQEGEQLLVDSYFSCTVLAGCISVCLYLL
jgi:hypothetical protein